MSDPMPAGDGGHEGGQAGNFLTTNGSDFHTTLLHLILNLQAMAGMKAGKGGIIANPNCSTIIALMAVTPLHRAGEQQRCAVLAVLCMLCLAYHTKCMLKLVAQHRLVVTPAQWQGPSGKGLQHYCMLSPIPPRLQPR